MTVGLPAFLLLAALLFSLGLYGVTSKKSAVMVLMSLELMANAVNINLVAFSRFLTPEKMTGQVFAMFMMVVAAAEIGLGLALVIALYRQTKTVELDHINELRG
ncbi:MAG: NADH-quinone oxidoreductase subunit NuoK [Actinobacteria bacterium HGW-Actinobacteria-7]|jgi:NADH:ubiquinone oxidoreductase subunit K|nr:MAG: NADH-quinone oxidoreductase subunit NuoK [Actinobacteria bacterium HGW-Actinobacteria-7]